MYSPYREQGKQIMRAKDEIKFDVASDEVYAQCSSKYVCPHCVEKGSQQGNLLREFREKKK